MTIKSKEIFLKAAVLGSIFHCIISPSHGMEEDDRDENLRLLKENSSLKSISLNSDHIYSTVKNLAEGIESLKIQSQQRRELLIKMDEMLTKSKEIQESKEKNFSLRIKPQDIGSLTFSSCGLTDGNAPKVANLLSQASHLRECMLSDNKFTSQSLKHILPALNSHPKLKILAFEENLIDDAGGKELLDFMKEKDSLKQIFLSGNHISKSIKQSIKKIGSFRSTGSDIESYTLRNCGFTDEDALQVATLLSQKTSLAEVNLGKNKLTSESLKHILPALEFYSGLEILNLESNLIDDSGVKELLTFLETKPSLMKIYLGGNNLTQDVEKIHEKFDTQKEKYNASMWGQVCQLF